MALPNGPELSVAVLAMTSRCCVFPVNPQNTQGEILGDMQSVNAKAIIVQAGQQNDHLIQVARDMRIPVISLTPDANTCALFDLKLHEQSPTVKADEKNALKLDEWTPRHGHSLVLHTSGTSGKKKIVPYSLNTICVGAACVLQSWELREDDVDLNMMPLVLALSFVKY